MRRFSAQYIITAAGRILKRGIITTDDEGCITEILDTGGNPPELSKTEFYNGIIVPGFINSHCHLELSDMKNKIDEHTGLGEFIKNVRENRSAENASSSDDIAEADKRMYSSGISACADICNNSSSFGIKTHSPVKYINFLEVFGIDPSKADKRIKEVIDLKKEADKTGIRSYIVPHSFYSMSARLISGIRELASDNDLTTIHFMESPQEKTLLQNAEGELMESYSAMGITPAMLNDRVPDHITGIKEFITSNGNLILVHNTYAEVNDIQSGLKRGNTWFCLCPGSNLFIENTLPPVKMMRDLGADIILGTDSLASNRKLDILEEMKVLSFNFPEISLEEIVRWATLNGAQALKIDKQFGSIETGKAPGLVLIENIDMVNLKLTPESRSIRLI